jgi:KAP family P-loop domain
MIPVDEAPETIALLSDEPASADQFLAKGHEAVAVAIAEIVQNEDGGRVIALEGAWGAGKSTVVRLVSKQLTTAKDESKPTAVLVFDAWAHQGDPLRRSFLDSLLRVLEGESWISNDTASSYRKNLSGRSSETHTRTTSSLSREGKIASAAALLVPLGAALFAGDFDDHQPQADIAGLLLLLGPGLVVALFAALKGVGWALRGNREERGRRAQLARIDAFGFFAKDQTSDTLSEGFDRGEPTSVEFEHLFSEILEHSLTGARRLLIVLDNIDRVREEDAQTVLATMQTFTSSQAAHAATWRHHVWTLIPFDPTGLDRLWQPAPSGERTKDVPSAAFAEKIFQVRFEAPPLVLSDWREYLTRLAGQALPDAAQESIQRIVSLRTLYAGLEPKGPIAAEAPTPRQLKQFVNRLAAVQLQRSDVTLVHAAYFALLRIDRQDLADGLLKGQIPHPKLKHLFEEGIEGDLAALHFGTARELAQQLLLGTAIERALTSGQRADLEALRRQPGFAEAVESLDLTGRSDDGGVELSRSIYTLSRADAFVAPGMRGWLDRIVLPFARAQERWVLAAQESGGGLGVLFSELAGSDEELTRLVSHIDSSPTEADLDARLFLEGAAGLLDELGSTGRDISSLRIKTSIPDEQLISALALLRRTADRTASWAAIEVAAKPAALANLVVAAGTSSSFNDAADATEVLLARPERVNWNVVVRGYLEWLEGQDPTSGEHLSAILQGIDRIRATGVGVDGLRDGATSGRLMHVVGLATRAGWQSEAASAAMLHVTVEPSLGSPALPRDAGTGIEQTRNALTNPSGSPEIIESQTTWLVNHSDEAAELLLGVAEAEAGFQPWVDHQLRALREASALEVDPNQYVSGWSHLQRALDEEGFESLTSEVIADVDARTTIRDTSRDPSLALRVLSAATEETVQREIRSWARLILEESPPVWEMELMNPEAGPLLGLATQLAATPDAPEDPPGLDDALRAHFHAIAEDQAAWRPDGPTMLKVTGLLSAATRSSRASELCAWLEGRDGQVGSSLFSVYGDFLASEASFRRHTKLPNVIERLVARENWDAVAWFVRIAQNHADAVANDGRVAETEHLARKVSEKLNEYAANAPQALTDLDALLQTPKK